MIYIFCLFCFVPFYFIQIIDTAVLRLIYIIIKNNQNHQIIETMQIILILSALFQIGLYSLFCYFNSPFYVLLSGFLFNTILLARIFVGFGFKYTISRLLRGQILPLYLYLLWLVIYPQEEHLFKIPIILSCIGKVYLLFTSPEGLWIDAVQNIIMLQSHCEIFVLFYHLLKLSISRKTQIAEAVFQYLLLVLIMKLKFEIHYGTRKSYQLIHFTLDRCAKSFKMRPCYHILQRLVSNLAGEWHHSKIISY